MDDLFGDFFGGSEESAQPFQPQETGAPSGNQGETAGGGRSASSSGGSGGLFGNASASVGDVAFAGDASADGDNSFEFGDTFFGDGPSKTFGITGWQVVALVAVASAAYVMRAR